MIAHASRRCGVLVLATFLCIPFSHVAAQSAPDGAATSWQVEGGLRLETDATGFAFPASIAFVPQPGTGPQDPLYFVAELRGRIKVVTNDRSVHVFAENVTDYRPRVELPSGSDAQLGMAGICLAPEQGFVFVTFGFRDSTGTLRNGIARFDSEPVRFGLRAGRRTDIPVLSQYEGGHSHQIGNCRVAGGHLYAGVGDGWQPYLAGDVTLPNGKLLRMGLGGEPVATNPFRAASESGVQAHVLAIGLRNPFGVALAGERVFVADNGTRVDRFLAIRPGQDYYWRGSDLAIATDAAFVFTESIGPAQMDFAAVDHLALPERLRHSFYIAASANDAARSLRPGVMAVRWNEHEGRLSEPPRWVVRAATSGDQMVAAVAVGPDGIYFAPLIGTAAGGSAVLKLLPDTAESPRRVLTSTVQQLFAERGCVGCHVLNDDYGFGSNVGPPLDSHGQLSERLARYLDSEAYVRSLEALDAVTGVHTEWAAARREVLAASGDERVRRWIKYRIMEPRFDRLASSMPTLQVPEEEAELMAAFLAGPPARRTLGARARQLVDRFLPPEGIGRKRLAAYFMLGGLLGAAVATGLGVMFRRRLQRHRD